MVAERGHAPEPSAEKVVGGRSGAWRFIASVEQKENFKGNEQLTEYATEHVVKVGTELPGVRDGILALMDENLFPSASTREPKAFYYEKKGDYYRSLVECATGDVKNKAVDVSMVLQRQAPMIPKVLKTVQVLQVQYIGKINDVSVVRQGQVPTIRTVQRTVEVPQVQFHDRVADVHKFLNDCEELIPRWLNTVKGVIDSEDLPLKVCRETLLQNKILRVIKQNYVMKCLEMLAEIAELNDNYKKSHGQCGKCWNHEDSSVGVETAEMLRFDTSKPGDERFNLGICGPHEGRSERRLRHHGQEYRCRILFVILVKNCASRVMRYFTWLTAWMNMPNISSRSPAGRS